MSLTLCATLPVEGTAHCAAWRDQAAQSGGTPTALTVQIAPLAPGELTEAAGVAAQVHELNAAANHPSDDELRAWMALPDHHVLRVRANDRYGDHGIVGLMLCHADEEDFVADGFMLKSGYVGVGIESEMIRALGQVALSSGCGAVVLNLIESATNRLAQVLFKGLGCGVETLASGVREVAFASQAVEHILSQAKSFLGGLWGTQSAS